MECERNKMGNNTYNICQYCGELNFYIVEINGDILCCDCARTVYPIKFKKTIKGITKIEYFKNKKNGNKKF